MIMSTQERIQDLVSGALAELASLGQGDDGEAWRIRYLGRRSDLTQILRSIADLPAEQRREVGQAANAARKELEQGLERWSNQAESAAGPAERADVTMPGYPVRLGSLHPLTRTVREIRRIFAPLGFRSVEGPLVEWDRNNFELLNIPPDHPARDMWDTLYVADQARPGEILLRTHTSPVQIRFMQATRPPVRVIMPGRIFRHEDRDPTHEAEFMQIEGLAIDEHITMADLRGTLTHFIRAMFGPERRLRFRASYFPFTEPSAEMDFSCLLCDAKGCATCSQTGWIEWGGCGMIHPEVLRNCGIDPEVHQGFAFGMGLERVAMLRHGIPQIRLLYEGDVRVLEQF